METSDTQRKATGDPAAYLLAGHVAPAGVYHETQTGRELRMEEAGVLPATFDGHVAVYVRHPRTWAEMDDPQGDKLSAEGAHSVPPPSLFCEQCAQVGVTTLADYVYRPEEASLAGPQLGDPDAWPPDVGGRRRLCREHYAALSADGRLDYVCAGAELSAALFE